jgi:Fe2+ transport system protein B
MSLTQTAEAKPAVVALGLESVGKSSLLAALSNRQPESSALAGSTQHCQTYAGDDIEWVDTPGIVNHSDADTVLETVAAVAANDRVLLVLRAHHAVEELEHLLPLLKNQGVAIALTHRDRVLTSNSEGHTSTAIWSKRLGVPVQLLDTRKPFAQELADLRVAIDAARPITNARTETLPSFPALPTGRIRSFSIQALGFSPVSLLLLLGPAWLAVTQANSLANKLYDPLMNRLQAPLAWLNELPSAWPALLAGDYGVVAMLPFLVLYALPTIVIFSGLLAVYKFTGLIDHLSYGLHSWLKPFGLGGRDLVRVVMGFGCNVPAIVATRSCSSCSRGACVSAISFGSACSYQLPATLAVFAASGYAWLSLVYLVTLAISSLLYLRWTTPRSLRNENNRSLLPPLGNLQSPNCGVIVREIQQSLGDFFGIALPIFVAICVFAGLCQWCGALDALTRLCAPLMALFRLPPEAALAIILGAVRKDGIAIGLLDANWHALKVPMDQPLQVLTAVYLAGVLLPCLVTMLTVVREMRTRFAFKMIARQASFAALFSLLIAWGGHLISLLFHT